MKRRQRYRSIWLGTQIMHVSYMMAFGVFEWSKAPLLRFINHRTQLHTSEAEGIFPELPHVYIESLPPAISCSVSIGRYSCIIFFTSKWPYDLPYPYYFWRLWSKRRAWHCLLVLCVDDGLRLLRSSIAWYTCMEVKYGTRLVTLETSTTQLVSQNVPPGALKRLEMNHVNMAT